MQILEVLLYNHEGEVRSIHLRPGSLNVITGESRSGKSALVDIIRYCLGEEFGIPHGPIREAVAWYGVRLTTGETEVFIGRPPPSARRGTASAVAFHAATHTAAPSLDDLEATTNTDALKRMLSGLLGIDENEQLPPPGARRQVPTLQANASHAMLFCFQLQDEIANRRLLFHRQQEQYVAQAIGDVLPFFLGAVEIDTIGLRSELRDTRRALDAARGRLARAAHIRDGARDGALSLVADAVSVGLIEDRSDLAGSDIAELAEVLRMASAHRIDEGVPPGNALQDLEETRSQRADEYRQLQDELQLVRAMLREDEAYKGVVAGHVGRLESAALLPTPSGESCPLCGALLRDHDIPAVSEMVTTFENLSAQLDAVERDRPRLRATLDDLERRAEDLRVELRELTMALDELASTNDQAAEMRARGQEQAFVKGKVLQYLATVEEGDSEAIERLETEVDRLAERVRSLEEALSSDAARANAVSILNTIGRDMGEWAQYLGLERPAVRIDLPRLTVVADTEQGAVPLALMGSAANWIGYHLVAHLGLHKHFVERVRPVPRFLVLDQPTQAYFPPDPPLGASVPENDADREAVTRMFELLSQVTDMLAPNFQILVLDHLRLDHLWFTERIAEEWRDGVKLVPAHWHPDA